MHKLAHEWLSSESILECTHICTRQIIVPQMHVYSHWHWNHCVADACVNTWPGICMWTCGCQLKKQNCKCLWNEKHRHWVLF